MQDSPVKQMRASYESYIQLPALLACPKPICPREDASTWHAERFFIVCHQTSELWLSQILLDLDQATRLVGPPTDWPEIRTLLARAASMTLLLCRLLQQLMTSCPRVGFMKFRPLLQGLSACDSMQFRELLRVASGAHSGVRKLDVALAREDEPTNEVYKTRARNSMAAFVDGVVLWRKLHVIVARSFLGDMPGTGYTSGVEYLLKRASGNGSADTENVEALAQMIDELERQMRSGAVDASALDEARPA